MKSMVLVTSEQFFEIVKALMQMNVITASMLRQQLVPSGIQNTAFLGSYKAGHVFKYVFFSNDGKRICVKIHDADLEAREKYGEECNSGAGWTAQISIGNRLVCRNPWDGTVTLVRKACNESHIPIVWDSSSAGAGFGTVKGSELG